MMYRDKCVCAYVKKVQIRWSIKRALKLLTVQHPGKDNRVNMHSSSGADASEEPSEALRCLFISPGVQMFFSSALVYHQTPNRFAYVQYLSVSTFLYRNPSVRLSRHPLCHIWKSKHILHCKNKSIKNWSFSVKLGQQNYTVKLFLFL